MVSAGQDFGKRTAGGSGVGSLPQGSQTGLELQQQGGEGVRDIALSSRGRRGLQGVSPHGVVGASSWQEVFAQSAPLHGTRSPW